MAQMALPPATQAVRYAEGRVVTLEARGRLAAIIERDRAGHVVRNLEFGEVLPGARQIEVRDFAPGRNGELLVALDAEYRLGRSARLVVWFGREEERRVYPLDEVDCRYVAQTASGAVWCLGRGPAGCLLYRLDEAKEGPRALLESSLAQSLPNAAGEPREPFEGGAGGMPQLLAAGEGLLAWLPNAGGLYAVPTRGGSPGARRVPVATGRSIISMAAAADGSVFALMPAPGSAQPEGFRTRYSVYRLNPGGSPESSRWEPLTQLGAWSRGTRLAGLDGQSVVIWIRSGSRLEWSRSVAAPR